MLVGRVVDDEVDDDTHPAVVRGADHLDEVAVVAQTRVDAVEVADVVAVVAVGGRIERHEPEARDTEIGEVVDAAGEAGEVADPVVVAVHVRLDVEAVDHRALPPQVAGVGDPHNALLSAGSRSFSARSQEGGLVRADAVDVDAVEAEPGQLCDTVRQLTRVVGDQSALPELIVRGVAGACIELLRLLDVPQRPADGRVPPLLACDLQGGRLGVFE